MASVVLKNIKKVYPGKSNVEVAGNPQITKEGVVAVQDFDLQISNNEFVVLVGPSGCGKSTVLRMIAGLEEITSGELFIDGEKMNDVEPKDRNIAMVFQSYALYPHMTVRNNIAYPLKLHHVGRKTIKEKVMHAAEILDIVDLLDRKPKELSGGQRQRVAIGRAIVRNPKVLLMDEPLSNLDAKLRNQMRAEIINLRKTIDTTFVYVTHDQVEAMTLGDRIVVMKDGFIQQIGTPQELFNHPKNVFVAGFIGTPAMNFFDAKLIVKRGKYYVDLDGYSVAVSSDQQAILSAKEIMEQPIYLGVRPNHLKLSTKGITGKVNICEMMGAEVHVHVNVNGQDVILITTPEQAEGLTADAEVKISYGSDYMHLFNRDSSNSLTNED